MMISARFLEHPGVADNSSAVASSKNDRIFSLSVWALSVSIYTNKQMWGILKLMLKFNLGRSYYQVFFIC